THSYSGDSRDRWRGVLQLRRLGRKHVRLARGFLGKDRVARAIPKDVRNRCATFNRGNGGKPHRGRCDRGDQKLKPAPVETEAGLFPPTWLAASRDGAVSWGPLFVPDRSPEPSRTRRSSLHHI